MGNNSKHKSTTDERIEPKESALQRRISDSKAELDATNNGASPASRQDRPASAAGAGEATRKKVEDPAAVIIPFLERSFEINAEESTAFTKKVFRKIARTKQLCPIYLNDLCLSHDYQLPKAKGASGSRGLADLVEQVKDTGLIQPPVVLKRAADGGVEFLVVSGRKRVAACKEIDSEQTIDCKLIEFEELFESDLEAGWPVEKKEALLREAFQNVVYSEAVHTGRLSDEAVLRACPSIS